MKPLNLQIVGLNSFREKQEIDFTQLCETGVFGIFGQTGSGKSSILDAITLALYGTVERAANNTQGILNHAEEVVSVKYAFALGVGAERITYRVERSYRRTGERTVKAAACRLVEISAESEKVLASKAEEITEKIENLLGLTAEDFTRAVVLPQGKFAEFLTIKPKDRRQMLERLFALEAYGKDLTSKLSQRLDAAKFVLNGVEQRQQGLGDASADRVEEAEKELQRASAAVTLAGQELEIRKQQFEADKEVWTLQLESAQIKEKEKELKSREQSIQFLSDRLESAERAERIRPLIEELNIAQTSLQEAMEKAERATGKLNLAKREQEEAELKWSEAFRYKTENEPLMQRRLEQVEQAKGLVQEIQERSDKLNQLREDYKKRVQEKEGLEQTLNSVLSEKTSLQNIEAELKQRLREIVIEPSRRAQVQAAAKALNAYELIAAQTGTLQQDLSENEKRLGLLRRELGAAETDVQQRESLVGDLKDQLNHSQQNPPVQEESLGQQAQETERFRALLSNIERTELELNEIRERIRRSEEENQEANNEVKRLKALSEAIFKSLQAAISVREEKAGKLKELEQNSLAAILREGLIKGEPCPVCGSLHHPDPVKSIDGEELAGAKAELEQAELELKALEAQKTAATTQIAVAEAGLKAKADHLERLTLEADEKLKQVKDYRDSLKEADCIQTVEVLREKLAHDESNLAAARLAWNAWKTEQEQKLRQLDTLQGDLTVAVAKAAQVRTEAAAVSGVGQEIRNRLEKLFEECMRKQKELDGVRGDISAGDILPLQERYAVWDRETADIGQKLSKLERELKVFDAKREDLLQKKSTCDLSLQDLTTAGREAAQVVDELRIKLEEMIGKQDVEELLVSVRNTLQEMQNAEKLLKQAFEQAQEALVLAQQEQAVLIKERELKQETLNSAQSRLTQGLKDAEFFTVAAAQSALCDGAEREKMKAEIKAYQQELASTQDRMTQVEGKLRGRTLAPEVWLAWPARLKQAEQEHANAVESRGAAHTNLNRLKELQGEWLRLEEERLALTHKHTLLKKLQTVFKGNSFVEFIAEEQLMTVAFDASERLGQLTNHRYALEVDSEGGFIMRDDANGGAHRPVSSLSGGETFLTSLALALALSTQIQLRGEVPLEFFFLDEGFGTLDPSLLEVVMNTLEKLRLQNLTIGIISHVPELKNRLARRLIVTSAEPGGAGSKVKLELA